MAGSSITNILPSQQHGDGLEASGEAPNKLCYMTRQPFQLEIGDLLK